MISDPELRRLGRLLKGVIRDKRRTLIEVSEVLGYAPRYLSRVLTGQLDLKLVDVFAMLRAVDVSPRLFFAYHYPFGPKGDPVPGQHPVFNPPMATDTQRLIVELERTGRFSLPQGAQLAERAGQLLLSYLRGAGMTQTAAAARLGLTANALWQVLHARAALSMWHVFALLRVLELSPARFFFELTAGEPAEVFDRATVRQFMDAMEATLGRLRAERLRREQRALRRVATKPKKGTTKRR